MWAWGVRSSDGATAHHHTLDLPTLVKAARRVARARCAVGGMHIEFHLQKGCETGVCDAWTRVRQACAVGTGTGVVVGAADAVGAVLGTGGVVVGAADAAGAVLGTDGVVEAPARPYSSRAALLRLPCAAAGVLCRARDTSRRADDRRREARRGTRSSSPIKDYVCMASVCVAFGFERRTNGALWRAAQTRPHHRRMWHGRV